MLLDYYPFYANEERTRYEFVSIGPEGDILKAVLFQEMRINLFNVAFGNWDPTEGKLDQYTRLNNQDSEMIFFTIAKILNDFLLHHPPFTHLFVFGVTPSRMRLFQRKIGSYWKWIDPLYKIHGLSRNEWIPFERGINFSTLVIYIDSTFD